MSGKNGWKICNYLSCELGGAEAVEMVGIVEISGMEVGIVPIVVVTDGGMSMKDLAQGAVGDAHLTVGAVGTEGGADGRGDKQQPYAVALTPSGYTVEHGGIEY